MFLTYLARELGNRKKQTIVIAIGLALAVALVMVISSIANGVRDAQAQALESIYGVGTDVTITQAATPPAEGEGGPQRFEFGADAGSSDGTTRELEQTMLTAPFTTPTFDAAVVDLAAETEGVAAAAGSLTLQNTTFSGEIADFNQFQGQDQGPSFGGQGEPPAAPEGGFDGAGGSGFGIDAFTVVGVDTDALTVGPLTATAITDGRSLDASDAGAHVAVLDADYATSAELAVGDTISVGDATDVEVVGLAQSTSTASGSSAGDVYLPLGTAQELAGLEGQVSTVYVQATSSDAIGAVQTALETALPDYTVNTQAELASTVSGSLAATASLITNLGVWLSVIVLAAAFLIAILFTLSGVARRTREFGTLKATGWSDGRVVGQVAGESLVTGLIGAAAGVALGLAAIWIVDLIAPTVSVAGASAGGMALRGPGGGGMQGGPASFGGGPTALASAASDITLSAPLSWSVVLIAVGLAVLGGIVAGVIGGWRAARLKPAEALRTIA